MVRLENITGNSLSYPANTNLYKRVVFIKNKFVGRIEFLSVFSEVSVRSETKVISQMLLLIQTSWIAHWAKHFPESRIWAIDEAAIVGEGFSFILGSAV